MLRRPTPLPRTTRILAACAATLALLAGCATGPRTAGSDADPEPTATATSTLEIEIDGRDLLLVDGTERRTLATVDEGELLYATLRPGRDADEATVLALTRTEGRYELRYLNLGAEGPTDLYWFPFRMQVSEDSAEVVDVPTLPVWAPDGSAVAWLEWDADGTRLRTVGWLDHDQGTNPSDDQATYRLAEVPPGTQLAAWEVDEDGTPVLVARQDDAERWRIRIEDGEPIVALEPLA